MPKEDETGYPEPGALGTMPSYGFFLRHVKGITLDNIQLHTLTDDARPPIALDDVDNAEFFRVKAQHAAGTPVFAVKNSSNRWIRMVDGTQDKQQTAFFQGQF